MTRQEAKMWSLAKSYGANGSILRKKMRTHHEQYSLDQIENGPIMTYNDIKLAVRYGCSVQSLLKRSPVGQPKYVILDLYKRAKQELWEETGVYKRTNMGNLIYV